MELTIDSETVRAAIGSKIIETLGEEQRTSILEQAVAALLVERKVDYGRTLPSPIQQAFNNAVIRIAQQVVDEYLAQPEVYDALRQQIADGTARFFKSASGSGVLAQAIAAGIEKVIEDKVQYRS